MNIAIIGLGEVGRCYAKALATVPGTTFQFCDTRLSQAGQDLVSTFGVAVREDIGDWLADADWVISCVFGAVSLDVAGRCFDHMKLGARYADLTTASPADKRVAAVRAKGKGLDYIDVAVMGAISWRGRARHCYAPAMAPTSLPNSCNGQAAMRASWKTERPATPSR